MGLRKLTLTTAFSYSVIGLCVLVCIGWQWEIPMLRSIIPGVPETMPMTAILLLLLGLALALSERISKYSPKFEKVVVRVIVVVVGLVVIFTGFQYIFDLPPSIETIFFPQIVQSQSGVFSGRPSGRTVITFLFVVTALLFAGSKKSSLQDVAVISSMLALLLPWIALFGYSTATKELYLIPNFPKTGMSPVTAITFIILSLGIMGLLPNRGIMGLFRSTSQGAKMARTFFLIVALVPLMLNWGVYYFIDKGHLQGPINIALEWGFFILLVAGIILWGGIIINKRDLEKEELLNSLKQAEEQFRTVIEMAPDAMIIANCYGIITLINEQARKMFKYPDEEMLGMEIESLLPEKLSISYKELCDSYNNSAQTRIIGDDKILKGVNKSGKEFPVEIGLSPIKINSEIMVSAIIRDISKRVKAEDELKTYVRNIGLVKQIARIGYYQTDSSLMNFEVSENLRTLFGAKKSVLSLEEIRALVHPEDLKKFKGILSKALETEENFELQFRIINPLTNKTFQVKNYNYFTRDSLGNIQVIGLLQDITQQKKVEKEILKLNKNLEQKVKDRTSELEKAHNNLEKTVEVRTEQLKATNDELEAFSYSVSHDLRAPLRAITGFSSILKKDYEGCLDDEGNRIISIIVNNTTLMGQLIDDILVFSKLSRSELMTTQLNIKTIFKIVYTRLLQEKENEGRNIEFTLDDIPPAMGDRSMITQVIVNLVSNALKYTEPRQKTIIHVGHEAMEGKNVYFIKDNGVGFDERHKSKLFQVFQRLHNDREFKGTGIGLAIVQRVIAKHGGEVWGESVLNKSATFYFTLS